MTRHIRSVAFLCVLLAAPSRAPAQAVTDADGNAYDTLAVGSQVWLKQNLRTTHYEDGAPIPRVSDNATWAATRAPAYCWYDNDSTRYAHVYGALYNWYVVDPGSNGHRNPCPSGWHVPTTAEWSALTTFLGGEGVAGGKLKEAGTAHWTSPNTGATNESGFTGLPGGYRGYVSGAFSFLGSFAHWWSATASDSSLAWGRGLFYLDASMDNSTSVKRNGFCLRCVKDEVAGVGEQGAPSRASLGCPNPFTGRTRLRLARSSAGPSRLAIFDLAGRLVRAFPLEGPSPGEVVVEWDGTDARGEPVPSGAYFCRTDGDRSAAVTRLVRIR